MLANDTLRRGCATALAIACAVLMSSVTAAGGPAEVLLVPNSAANTVMAFDAYDGTMLDAEFIPDPGDMNGVTFSRPLHAIASGWGTILVSDQLRHMIAEFDYDGNYIRIFAPIGGPNQAILRNVRGLALSPDGDVLVSNLGQATGVTANAIARFDQSGDLLSPFVFERYGGIAGPFDVLVLDDMVLVAADQANFVARYTLDGRFDELFARDVQFPQQLAEAANGNILLAVFSGGYIAEYDRQGNLVGQYTAGLSQFRGVCELGNGNLLVTTNTGVHEITRQNQHVATKFAGSEMRYIERITLPGDQPIGSAPPTDVHPQDSGPPRSVSARQPPRDSRAATSSTPRNGIEFYIVEDSGYFNAPGINAGTIGRFSLDDPSQVEILGEAGGHLGPFNWGGIAVNPDDFELYGFENTTNSVRRINPGGGNELIDSVGHIGSGIAGFSFSNDGSTAYVAGNVSFWGRIVQADAATGEVLSVHSFANRSFGSVAVVPEDANLPYEAGELLAIVNIGSPPGVQLHRLDLDSNTTTNIGGITGLGFNGAFESGLTFGPDGTLYAAIQGFLAGGGDVSSHLFIIDPATAAATLIGVIQAEGTWDAASIAVIHAPEGPLGDLNGDGVVDVSDLLILLGQWGPCPKNQSCPADLNNDGVVDVSDLLILLGNWG